MKTPLVVGTAIFLIILVAAVLWRSPAAQLEPETTLPTDLEDVVTQATPAGFTPVPEEEINAADTTEFAAPDTPVRTAPIISIEDAGFVPAKITVPVNAEVTFTNNGQGEHWPASGPHPAHTALPGFDAKKALATGESYRFTFTKKGTWHFHDHLHPEFSGTVIVQ